MTTFKGNMEPDINKLFIRLVLKCFAIALIIVIIMVVLGGCSFFRTLEKNEDKKISDTTAVKKETISTGSIDTTKTKKSETSTKETIYYPQPIYVEGKNGETKVVFVPQSTKETGVKTEETDNAKFSNWLRSYNDSLKIVSLQEQVKKETKTEASVLSLGQTIGLGVVGIVIIAIVVLFFWLIKKVNLVSQILKSK